MVGRPRKQAIDGRWKCARCKMYKPESEFYKSSTNLNGLMNSCKACTNAYHSERKARIGNGLRRLKYQRLYPAATQSEVTALVEWSLLRDAAEAAQDFEAYNNLLSKELVFRRKYDKDRDSKDQADSDGPSDEDWAAFEAYQAKRKERPDS